MRELRELRELLTQLIDRAKDFPGVDDFTFRTELIACSEKFLELAHNAVQE